MRVTRLEPFILHVPVTRQGIADSVHHITHWGVPGVKIATDADLVGVGYAGTHAHLPTDRLITACIVDSFGPLLVGEDPQEVQHLWHKLAHEPPIQWVGRGGIVHLALAAIDIALWDIKAKAAGCPLWKLLGGNSTKRITAYNTDGGWINWDDETLVADCRRLVEEGFSGVKMKIGSPSMGRDLTRLERVRATIGPDKRLMVDANGRLDLASAIRIGSRLCNFDVEFFEEPLSYDDVEGHRRLADAITTPIALGEQLYLLDHFRSFINAGAIHYAQPDVTRLAGITEWWQVADVALANRLPVVPHVGDMMQVHLHCAIAHPACTDLEYLPWLRDCFVEPASVAEGVFVAPQAAGAGTDFRDEAFRNYRVG